MLQNKIYIIIGYILFFGFITAQAIDNPHFYRATNMFLEPRIEHDFLTTVDVTIGGGKTHTGRNKNGTKVPLFDIYGPSQIIQNDKHIVNLSINGTFNIKEANLFFTQNFLRGFFLLLHLPIRSLNIHNILFTPLSEAQLDAPIKQQLISEGLNPASSHETGAGDFSSMIGWTHNYQNTTTLDFIDFTIGVGMLAPTGKTKNERQLFSLPLGYNGHWGIPVTGRLSIGMYEWITLGATINTIFFTNNTTYMGLKTASQQTGIIFPVFGKVSIKKGPVWDAGIFLKADHFMYGLSFTAGYSCAGEAKTTITSKNSDIFDKNIINSDQRLKEWYMHTVHFALEYDFTKHDAKAGPRVGFFYNLECGGIRTFNTDVAGGSFGLDIGWDM